MKKNTSFLTIIFIIAIAFSSCGKGTDPAVKAVEDYVNALVNKDASSLSILSCATWEANAQLELDSFSAVKTRLEGLDCSVTGTVGTTTEVVCKGKIITTYNNEDQSVDLSVNTYQVVKQGSDYLMCGYK